MIQIANMIAYAKPFVVSFLYNIFCYGNPLKGMHKYAVDPIANSKMVYVTPYVCTKCKKTKVV